jgi:hypothetical protein
LPTGGAAGTYNIAATFAAAPQTATTSAATSASPSDTITVTGSGQLIDPGASNKSIAFIAGASNDTLVLYAGGVDQISGFSLDNGDKIDLQGVLAAANLKLSDVTQLSGYLTTTSQGGIRQSILIRPARGEVARSPC